MKIDEYIEHTCLKPDTVLADIERICKEAVDNNFTAICVPPLFVKKAKELTGDSKMSICTAIGFPFGYSAIEAKLAEVVLAIIDGADEVNMVVNTIAVKNNDWQYLASEINMVIPIIRNKGKKIAVILETGLLTDSEIVIACDIYGAAAVDFVAAGTGFFEDVSLLENIKLIRKHLAAPIQLKTALDNEDYDIARNLIKAGANRLCCNNSLQLIQKAF